MRFILGIALIYGFAAQFAASGSHVGLSNTRKKIIIIGRALSGGAENACNGLLCKEYFNYKIIFS